MPIEQLFGRLGAAGRTPPAPAEGTAVRAGSFSRATKPCTHGTSRPADAGVTAAVLSSMLNGDQWPPPTAGRAAGVFQPIGHRVLDGTPLIVLDTKAAADLGWFGRWVQFAICGAVCWHQMSGLRPDLPPCPGCERLLARHRPGR